MRILHFISLTTGISLGCFLAGCSEPLGVHGQETERAVAAKVGEKLIYLDEVDSGIQLKLYDLQQTIYQLRQASLQQLLANPLHSDSATLSGAEVGGPAGVAAEVLLQAPPRPRIGIPADARPARGNPDAPVQLDIFCSYQSSHCVRLQPTLLKILEHYRYLIGIRYFDFPQAYHHRGRMLAEAVRCAGDQDAAWQFQDHLLARVETIGRDDIPLLATSLELDVEHLQTCLDTHKYSDEVEYDIALAEKLGIGSVPVAFVNGLYLPGPQPLQQFAALIDGELARLGIEVEQPDNEGLPLSQLPITLLACSVSSEPENSKALLSVEEAVKKGPGAKNKSEGKSIHWINSPAENAALEPQPARFYSLGSELMSGVVLQTIERDKVIVDNNGRRELIRLWTGSEENSAPQQPPDNGAEALGDITLPEPTAILPLSRNWVDDQLMEQAELERQIERAELQVEGHNLLKLSDKELDDFYQTLGLEPGDVFMMVDRRWVHSDHNPLWEILQEENHVTLVVMRRGLPVVYEYNIQ